MKALIITLCLSICSLSSAKDIKPDIKPDKTPRHYKIADEREIHSTPSDFHPNLVTHNYEPVKGTLLTYTFHPTGVFTVYDIQSNAVPDEIWQDPLSPNNVHAVFMYSLDSNFATRHCAYLFSNDGGNTWTNLGDVPSSGRSGFPSISGLPSGAAVIANQNTTNGTTATSKINYDAGAGFGVFTEIEPPNFIQPLLWPRILATSANRLLLAVDGNTVVCLNSAPPGTFGNLDPYSGSGGETYFISQAPNGNVGHAYIGEGDGVSDHDVFYRVSTDGGITWSIPQKIWDWNLATDSLGCLRGISMVFGNNNEPYVAFEVSKLDINTFYPGLPSSIRVWSPNVNGGVPKIVADENNVPFFPNKGNVSDAFMPVCRPAIGRSSMMTGIFVAFNATSGNYGVDTSSYFGAWLTMSSDNGNSWGYPERMTPPSPLRDWRYVSISQINELTGWWQIKIHLLCQSDSVAGAYANGSPIGTAEAVEIEGRPGFTFLQHLESGIASAFSLAQNFPNPFNPSTSIRFNIAKQTNVTLKVYNSNGQEVETLVDNEILTPGTKEVFFDGNNLSSGIYFYTIIAGEFKETKKMILLK